MTRVVTVEPFLVAALAALFDDDLPAPLPGEPLPPYWHLAACAAPVATRSLDVDGHARTGVIVAPHDLPLALLELLRLDGLGSRVTDVEFVARAPVFCGDEVELSGTQDEDLVRLQAQVGDVVAMTASVSLVPA
jgi:hydroxyacyl-ACP dehydratase HTD2-like protein with hotdog domain